ncbi:porin family protein [uncultured Croceitalea sp.]|uniref:porin family protein n=1 Tax=uncultured Croceitalea sp. TaxID=1798908 RepID=UPI0033066E20
MIRTIFVTVLFCLVAIPLFAQEDAEAVLIDDKYLEDQFYAGLSYNLLSERPGAVTLRNLSYSLQLGFIKDIPLNARRNFGLGLGFGYGTSSYYSNLIAERTAGNIAYRTSVASDSLNRSKFETHSIEFPFELRWRTSNTTDYKFWRVYAGVKAEYLFSRRSKAVFDGRTDSFDNDDVSPWQYGLTLNFGYNTWNLHFYYSLNPLLENNASLNGEQLRIRPIRVGVVFYIL